MTRNMLSKVIAQLEPSATEEADNTVKRMRQEGVQEGGQCEAAISIWSGTSKPL